MRNLLVGNLRGPAPRPHRRAPPREHPVGRQRYATRRDGRRRAGVNDDRLAMIVSGIRGGHAIASPVREHGRSGPVPPDGVRRDKQAGGLERVLLRAVALDPELLPEGQNAARTVEAHASAPAARIRRKGRVERRERRDIRPGCAERRPDRRDDPFRRGHQCCDAPVARDPDIERHG